MASKAVPSRLSIRKYFDVAAPFQENENVVSQGAARLETEVGSSICYGASTTWPSPNSQSDRRYRKGGTKRVTVAQAINLNAAVHFAGNIGLPLNAHFTIHWVGTDAGDDPDGKLFAQVREGYARRLRRRSVPFTGIWCREKLSGGQAEVEHAHLIVHLPTEWLVGAKLIDINGGLDGRADLLQAEAAMQLVVDLYAGRQDDYAVKLKLPTDGGLPGPYNRRSYDGLYLLKGGGPNVWKLFPRIRKEWRRPQGIILGKRCGTTQNLGPAARRRLPAAHEYELKLVERARRLRETK